MTDLMLFRVICGVGKVNWNYIGLVRLIREFFGGWFLLGEGCVSTYGREREM